jgi:hypothetical protein
MVLNDYAVILNSSGQLYGVKNWGRSWERIFNQPVSSRRSNFKTFYGVCLLYKSNCPASRMSAGKCQSINWQKKKVKYDDEKFSLNSVTTKWTNVSGLKVMLHTFTILTDGDKVLNTFIFCLVSLDSWMDSYGSFWVYLLREKWNTSATFWSSAIHFLATHST